MAEDNPYAAPVSDAARAGRGGLDEDRVVTPEILEAMTQTRPWVVLIAVLGFIGGGLLVLIGVGTFAFGTFNDIPIGGAGFLSLFYVGIAAIYVFASLYLWRYGAAIKLMQEGYGVHALTDALRQQKAFWRISGVVALVMVVLWSVGLLAVVALRG
jgi:hypothetical protein